MAHTTQIARKIYSVITLALVRCKFSGSQSRLSPVTRGKISAFHRYLDPDRSHFDLFPVVIEQHDPRCPPTYSQPAPPPPVTSVSLSKIPPYIPSFGCSEPINKDTVRGKSLFVQVNVVRDKDFRLPRQRCGARGSSLTPERASPTIPEGSRHPMKDRNFLVEQPTSQAAHFPPLPPKGKY